MSRVRQHRGGTAARRQNVDTRRRPTSVSPWVRILSQAHAAAKSAQWEAAVRLYQQVITQQPDQLEALESLGIALLRLAQPAEAARCLDKGARVLGPNGKAFTQDGIGMALGMRELSRHLRELSPGGQTHHAGFSKQDRSRFLGELENCIQALKRGN